MHEYGQLGSVISQNRAASRSSHFDAWPDDAIDTQLASECPEAPASELLLRGGFDKRTTAEIVSSFMAAVTKDDITVTLAHLAAGYNNSTAFPGQARTIGAMHERFRGNVADVTAGTRAVHGLDLSAT